MMELTPEGRRLVDELAQRHGVSSDAVLTLLRALAAGNGTMAQFSHPELGGTGQWSQGGMIMIGEMFNNALKHRVDALCSELAALLSNQPWRAAAPSQSQTQSQSAGLPRQAFQGQAPAATPGSACSFPPPGRPLAPGGQPSSARRHPPALRMTSATPASRPPVASRSRSTAASRSTTPWTTRSPGSRSNRAATPRSPSPASTASSASLTFPSSPPAAPVRRRPGRRLRPRHPWQLLPPSPPWSLRRRRPRTPARRSTGLRSDRLRRRDLQQDRAPRRAISEGNPHGGGVRGQEGGAARPPLTRASPRASAWCW